jgi:hypothetical protein
MLLSIVNLERFDASAGEVIPAYKASGRVDGAI